MTIIGSAYVDIRAITDHLEADIKKALATLPDTINVHVNADTTAAEAQIDLLVEWGNIHTINVNVAADTLGAEAHIEALVETIDHEEAHIDINVDTVGARAHVDEFIDGEDGRHIDVSVDVDEAVAITKMEALRAKLDAIAKLKPITIPVAVGNGKGPIGEIENALSATSKELDKANLKLTFFGQALKNAGDQASSSSKNVVRFLDGLSGGGALLELTKELIGFKINLGNEVPQIALAAEKFGAMATGASFAAGNILSLASSIGELGGVAVALPGILTGFVIGMKLTTIAFGDMKKAVPDVYKEFQDLRAMISQDFWSTARTGLMDLVAPTSVLRSELVSTSKVLGTFWGTMFEGMSKGTFAKAMAGDFDNLKKSIEITTSGSSTFLHIIQTLGEFGSAYLPKLAQSFLNVSQTFDAFLTKANADGTLKRWVDGGVQGFKDLAGVVGNTASVIGGLMKAATDAGGASLGILSLTMERFAAVVREPAVQAALVNIFSGANIAMKSAIDGLGNFLKGVGYLSPALKVVEQDVGIAIHNVLTFFGSILSNPTLFKGIQDLFGGIVLGLDHFAAATGPIGDKLGIFFTVIGKLADSLGGVFANAVIQILPLVASLLSDIIPLIQPLGDITTAVVDALAPAIGILVKTAFPPLIALLTGSVLPALKTLADAAGKALPPMAAAMGDAISKLAPIFGDLITHVTPIIEKIIEIGAKAIPVVLSVLPGLLSGLDKLFKAIEPILNPILDLINGFLDMKGAGVILAGGIAIAVLSFVIFNAIIGPIAGIMKGILLVTELYTERAKIAAAAQWLWNFAMDANPVGLIVLGIAALIAIIVLLVANWDTITKAISDFVTSSGLGEWVNQTIGMFADFGKNTLGMFVDFFNNTIGMFRDFFTNTVGMFVDFFNNTVGMIVDWGTRSVGMFVDFFNNTVGMVRDWGARTVGMFVDFFTNTVGMFTDFFNKVVEGFKGFAHDPIGEVHKFVDGTIKAITDWGVNLIVTITQFFVQIRNTTIDWAVNAAINFIKFFTDVIQGFQNWRDGIINTVVKWAMDMAVHIGQFEADAKAAIMKFVVNTVGMFKDFFTNTIGMFTDFWNNLPNTVATFVVNTMGMIRDFNTRTNGMFMDFFNNTLGMFSDFFTKNIPDTVNEFNKQTNGMFNDFVANTLGMFGDFFGGIFGMWNDFISNTVGMVSGWVAGLIGMFTDYYAQTTGETRAFLDGFIASVGGFVNNTIGMFADFGGNVVSTFQDMWTNATNAVTTGIDTVIGWITGVGGRITGAIGDLGGLLAHAGQAIMDGFLGGLNAGFKGVQDMVGGVADWIAQHKGPEAYDRALLVPHGGWIMGGLKQGIEGSMGGLQKTLTNVTDLVKSTMSDATMAVNLTSSTTSNPNIFSAQSQGPVDIFAAAANAQSIGAGRTVITPTVNVYPSAPLNEKQVGQMAASELYWNFVNR